MLDAWMGLGGISRLTNAQSRSISPENRDGARGAGGMAQEGTGIHCARELGRGWKISPSIVIQPGETAMLADIDGPGIVQSIWFAGRSGSFGREMVLRFYWDDQAHPSVEVPIADFFAFGWNSESSHVPNAYPSIMSVPVMVAPNRGFNCFWPMPFRGRCRISMENTGAAEQRCYYQINYSLEDVPSDAGYFHAQFRRVQAIPYKQDYVIADGIRGKGQYVGTALCVGLNTAGRWWGEGEIKFFLDGDDAYPTICGTGTEDYFGGAYNWDAGKHYYTYSGPFMGMYQVIQPDGLYQSQQRFAMYRWHLPDPIRFERGLRVTLQDLGWRTEGRYLPRQDDFASVAYWYQALPTAPFPPLPDKDQREIG